MSDYTYLGKLFSVHPVSRCWHCGAIVSDTEAHDRFHRKYVATVSWSEG